MVGLQSVLFGWQINVGTIAGAGHLLQRFSFGLFVEKSLRLDHGQERTLKGT
jgi:hypothetical protein